MPEIKADLSKVRLVLLKKRHSKVHLANLGGTPRQGISFQKYWENLPNILAVQNLKLLVDKIRQAKKNRRPILIFFGAHVIKVGLSRYVEVLMEKGFVSAFATNGAGLIHDFELAFGGETSEDVAVNLKKGTFGFAKETGDNLNRWAKEAAAKSRGLGSYVGETILKSKFPNKNLSLFAKAYALGVPATAHVAIGTDIIYQHPSCDGAAWGKASYEDFKIFAGMVGKLASGGGVVMNWGSSVLMPEVFLKALAINKNLGKSFKNLTCANFDMIPHYRPRVNVLERPTQEAGSIALNFIGHHEILLPLLAQALIEIDE